MSFNRERTSLSKKIGLIVGKGCLLPTMEYLRDEFVNKFNVVTEGKEHLQSLIDQPHILFSNHNALRYSHPRLDSGLMPDHLFIFNQVFKATDQRLAIVVQVDQGKLYPGILRTIQNDFLLPAGEGLYEALGDDIIPVKNNPGSLSRKFLPKAKDTICNNRSLLIFPQGVGKVTYNPNLPFESGVYHILRKHRQEGLPPIPVLPVHISGCDSWIPYKGQIIRMRFGEPFTFPPNFTKEDIATRMKDEISKLKSNADR